MASYTVSGEIQNHEIKQNFTSKSWMMISIGLMTGLMIFWVRLGLMTLEDLKLTFDDDLFKESWFEGRPELFVIVRDPVGKIVHKTKPQNPSGPDDSENLSFQITIPEKDYYTASPYDSVNTRRIAAFAGIGDTLDLTDDITNSSQLLLQSLNAWLLYTNEPKWHLIGYDGPQVDRYPWRSPPTPHRLSWNDQ